MSVPPAYQPPPKKSRAHAWVLGIGGVLVLLSLLLCAFGGFGAFNAAKDLVDQPMHHGSYTVALEDGESTSVFSEDELATCTASGPNGPVENTAVADENVSFGDRDLHRVMAIDADGSGDYTINCTAPFVVGEGVSVAGIVAASIGGALCCLGSVVVIIGLIIWIVRRR
ncbi:hypothetical protein [Janibacter corallicola]|uniref:hypothetical protein n=1 Tax=Janibacter corallicola TaxID=415212 RepID=UPI000829B960|nr:hypothetical protein [Janibacter corallicola]